MTSTHPSRQTLELFLHGQLPQPQTRDVVGHLLKDCPICREVTGDGWEQIINGLKAARIDFDEAEVQLISIASDSPYRQALNQARGHAMSEALAVERDRAAAEQLVDELMQHPHKRRLTLVQNSRRFQSPGLCELLAEKGFDQRFSDVQLGIDLTELAVAVGQQLTAGTSETNAARVLEGRAWAYHGNAQRVASDLRMAEKAFQEASQCFSGGLGDDLDRALMYRFTALLLRARQDFAGARSRQDQAVRLYLRNGETLIAGNVIADQALGTLYEGNPEAAIPMFERALEILTSEADPRNVASVQHNLAYCLAETGQLEKALERITEVRPRLQEFGDSLSLIRLRWLEGKIFAGQDRTRQAEEALVEAREAFVEEAIGYDAALVSLDLAAIYARQGRVAEMRELAESILPIFQSRDVHREALAALILFRDAALAETVSLALVEEISRFLHRARHDPKVRFEAT